jgi:glycine hydroxymethyltransferase
MGGPVGGLVLTDNQDLATRISRMTFPSFLQTRDQNKYAALAITLAELEEHGRILARQMVANANALAISLEAEGFTVINRRGIHSETHQVLLDLGAAASAFERRCHAANLLIPDCAVTGDRGSERRGARLGTHEISKLGMTESEMTEIASLIGRAYRDDSGAASSAIAADVRALMRKFPTAVYSFDGAAK